MFFHSSSYCFMVLLVVVIRMNMHCTHSFVSPIHDLTSSSLQGGSCRNNLKWLYYRNSEHKRTRRTKCLMSQDDNDDERKLSKDDEKKKWEFRVDDDVLVLGDVMSLTICCLLIGMFNVIQSPEFLLVGGWAAPIPAVPSTVGATITKASHMGVSWLLAGVYNVSFTYSAVADRPSIVKSIISTWVTFCSIEIILAISLAAVAGFEDGILPKPVDSIDLFKSLIAVLPGLFAWRILFSQRINGYF